MNIPSPNHILPAIQRSITLLKEEDGALFALPIEADAKYDSRKLHEVCINHKLAEHLATEILPLLDGSQKMFVDIEFNREGLNFKTVVVEGAEATVRPDIIIHNRKSGADKVNLLIVECKKIGASQEDLREDENKVAALMSDPSYDYHFGLQILYGDPSVTGTFFSKKQGVIIQGQIRV